MLNVNLISNPCQIRRNERRYFHMLPWSRLYFRITNGFSSHNSARMQADLAALQAQHAELEVEFNKLKADATAAEKLLRDDAQRASNEALSARMEAVRAKVLSRAGTNLYLFHRLTLVDSLLPQHQCLRSVNRHAAHISTCLSMLSCYHEVLS